MARANSSPCYERHRPEDTVLYRILEGHLEAFLAGASEQGGGEGLPAFVTPEHRAYLRCAVVGPRWAVRSVRRARDGHRPRNAPSRPSEQFRGHALLHRISHTVK